MIEVIGVAEIILQDEHKKRQLNRNQKHFKMKIIETLPNYNHYRVKYQIHLKEMYTHKCLEDYYSFVKPGIEKKVPGIVTLIQYYSIQKVYV